MPVLPDLRGTPTPAFRRPCVDPVLDRTKTGEKCAPSGAGGGWARRLDLPCFCGTSSNRVVRPPPYPRECRPPAACATRPRPSPAPRHHILGWVRSPVEVWDASCKVFVFLGPVFCRPPIYEILFSPLLGTAKLGSKENSVVWKRIRIRSLRGGGRRRGRGRRLRSRLPG